MLMLLALFSCRIAPNCPPVQVFRARKRKHTSPVTSSSKSKKKNYEGAAAGEIPGISPSKKCSLEAFIFNAKPEDPPASNGGPSGAVPEPELPALRRGEVKFSSNKPWLTPCSLASRPASAEGFKDPIQQEEEAGSVERTDADRSSTLSPSKAHFARSLPSPAKTQLIHSESEGVAENNKGKEFFGTVVEATDNKTDSSVDKKSDGAGTSHLSQIANEFLSLCFRYYCSSSSTITVKAVSVFLAVFHAPPSVSQLLLNTLSFVSFPSCLWPCLKLRFCGPPPCDRAFTIVSANPSAPSIVKTSLL